MKPTFLAIAAFTLVLSNASAQNGSDRGGGNTLTIKQATIELKIKESLKAKVSDFFMFLLTSRIKDTAIRASFENMIRGGIAKDIQPTPYTVAKKCVDRDSKLVAASTVIGQRKAEICFDSYRLARDYLTASDETLTMVLVSLAVHEHAHQFGMNEALATQVGGEVANQFEQVMAMATDQAKVVKTVKNPKAGSVYTLQAAELIWFDFPNGAKIAVGCDVFQDEWQRYAFDVKREADMTYRFGPDRMAFFNPANGNDMTGDAYAAGQRTMDRAFGALGRWFSKSSPIEVICKERGRVFSPISERDLTPMTDVERRKRIHSCYVVEKGKIGPNLLGDKYYYLATYDGTVVKKSYNKQEMLDLCRKMDEESQCVCYPH